MKLEEGTLNNHFREVLSELEIVVGNPKITNLFGLFGKVLSIRVPSGEEIKLKHAKEIFYNAYYAALRGDAIKTDFANQTEEYLFAKGVKLAREVQKSYHITQ